MSRAMSEATFRLAYDGDAVRDGEMEITDLAPALLGLAQLLKAAGRVLEGDDAEIGVRVKATREGSFDVWLNLIVNDAHAAWKFWRAPETQAAVSLLEFMGFSGTAAYGVVQVVRRLKGRLPRRVRTGADTVILEVDGDAFEVPEPVARLALDPPVRAALEKVVTEPLGKEGIDRVSLGDVGVGPTIEKAEAEYFRAIGTAGDDEFASRYTKAFTIVALSFKTGQKWRLNDGRSSPLVTVSDESFIAKVDAGEESFTKGDMLICEVVESSHRTATGFKSEYEIVRVVEHRKFQPPTSFFDASP